MYNHKIQQLRVIILVVLVALFAEACVVQRSPVTGRKRAYGYTWEQEKQIGAEADPQIIAQFGLYDDQALARYVDDVGKKVLATSHLRRADTPPEYRDLEFHFRVLDSPVVNAFALPGGYIYVTRGLLAHLQNEAQLAMVLGHEIGHVAGRHASKRAFQSQLGQLGLIGGAILGQELLGLPGQDLLSAGGTVAQLLFLRYGRDDERESDRLGVEYAALAGYKAGEGSEFFVSLDRIGEQAGQSIPSFLATHPDPGERKETIKQLAAEWETRAQMTIVREPEYLARVDEIVFGDDPRQGYTENGVFYHPQLRFRFPLPQGYQVVNQPSQVAMVEPDGNAIVVLSLASGQTTAAGAGQKIAGQEGVVVRDRGSTSVNGMPAYYVLGDATAQNQQVIRFLAYYIEYGGNVYQFVGYSLRDNFSQYDRVFRNTMTGFAPENNPAVLNVQPTRVDIEAARTSGTFESLISGRVPKNTTPESLAILNQVQLSQVIPPSRQLKMLR